MDADWAARAERWQRFRRWEDERLRSRPGDLSAALAWMSEAWELASRFDPSWGSLEKVERRCRDLAEIQRRLARSRVGP